MREAPEGKRERTVPKKSEKVTTPSMFIVAAASTMFAGKSWKEHSARLRQVGTHRAARALDTLRKMSIIVSTIDLLSLIWPPCSPCHKRTAQSECVGRYLSSVGLLHPIRASSARSYRHHQQQPKHYRSSGRQTKVGQRQVRKPACFRACFCQRAHACNHTENPPSLR
eukprot:116512-Rhodomonas_salina.2